MPRESRKNVGESVRAGLLKQSRDQRTDFQVLLTRYALERLLYRLSQSAHRNRFVLKGAMLFATWVAVPFRPTRDLDLLGYGENSTESIREAFREICRQMVADDGVAFDVDGIEATPIREDLEYGGVRIRTRATITAARIPIQVDIGFGDVITPGPVEIDYPALLDAPAPHLRAYPIETVIAEKFHALVTRGIANSRLKDFYDLWLIAETFELDRSSLATAIRQTFTRRATALPDEKPTAFTESYASAWGAQWQAFLRRERMTAAPAQLAQVLADLERFLLPLLETADGNWSWKPRAGWVRGID
jgi:predicted nucleotidyltransferase component of viral defense system